MKTVLFVPGFREDINSRDYNSTINAIESRGYKVVFVPINWTRSTLIDWVQELNNVYGNYDPKETILAGFSYGAMTAFMTATERNPSELWLFSLSPYFSDDMPKMRKSWLNSIGHRRADVFRALDFNLLAKNINCKTLLFVGEKEVKKYPLLGTRASAAHEQISRSTLTVVANTGHDVANKQYVESIKDMI